MTLESLVLDLRINGVAGSETNSCRRSGIITRRSPAERLLWYLCSRVYDAREEEGLLVGTGGGFLAEGLNLIALNLWALFVNVCSDLKMSSLI